jgi:hypothetical protein
MTRWTDDLDDDAPPEDSLPWPVVICLVSVALFLSIVVWMLR